jgi:sulfur-oxidizing protein SoxZ
MAEKTIKLRAKVKDEVVEVKALIKHPMESGQRKDSKTGELIPAHYITELTCEHGGKTRLNASLSGGVSQNPYVSFKFKGAAAGDPITMSWKDNKGDSDSTEAKIN